MHVVSSALEAQSAQLALLQIHPVPSELTLYLVSHYEQVVADVQVKQLAGHERHFVLSLGFTKNVESHYTHSLPAVVKPVEQSLQLASVRAD